MQTGPANQRFRIRGMDCAEEVAVLKREIGPVVGGEENLSFDVLNGKMTVAGAVSASADAIREAVAKTGMSAELWGNERNTLADQSYWERNRRTILTFVSGGLLLFALLVQVFTVGFRFAFGIEEDEGRRLMLAAIVCYAFSIFAGVWTVLPKAWIALKRFAPDMNLLMVVAVSGAVALGQWSEAATVAFLFALSLALEAWSVGRARRAVAALMELSPTQVRIIQDGHDQLVPPESVSVGTEFIVRPGDKIPLDGQVVEGSSEVNQAPITGESSPVSKQVGAAVFAGTINGNGSLTVRSTKVESDTTLARIIRLVGEAQSRRSPSEQWVERFARIYTPAIMAVAVLVLLLPPLLFGKPWSEWIYNALVLLVIACPCALVISTPVSIVAALASAARHGVLIKGGVFVEVPAKLKAIAFDKTGTLTNGTPSVVALFPMNGHGEDELLERAAAMESLSGHPLARAIVQFARERGVSIRQAEDFQIVQGKGATATVKGRPFWIGSHRFLEEKRQETADVHERLESLASEGKTVVVVGNDEHVCGLIVLADAVRPQARQVVEDLRATGIAQLVMLTGDNRGTAQTVAAQTGVDSFRAELLPEDKVRAVEELAKTYAHVAMVGDGVNDAPAMGRATLGIAMAAAGSDAAIETADVALMSDDLSKLPWLIRHSRRAVRIIQQNIFFALSVKALFVLLTVIGHASLWAAIAADTGASLLVVFNGLRLLRA